MPYANFTLAALRTRLQVRWESAAFWTDEEARLGLNEGLRVWNALTGSWRERIALSAAGGPYLTLPGMLVWPTRVAFNETPLHRSSFHALDQARPGWEGETTASGGSVPTTPIVWAPSGVTEIAIWPTDAGATNHLTVDGIARTPVLVNDADTVDISDGHIASILDYALLHAAFKLPGLLSLTRGKLQQVLAAAGQENNRLLASSAYKRAMGKDDDRHWTPLRRPERVLTSPTSIGPDLTDLRRVVPN